MMRPVRFELMMKVRGEGKGDLPEERSNSILEKLPRRKTTLLLVSVCLIHRNGTPPWRLLGTRHRRHHHRISLLPRPNQMCFPAH